MNAANAPAAASLAARCAGVSLMAEGGGCDISRWEALAVAPLESIGSWRAVVTTRAELAIGFGALSWLLLPLMPPPLLRAWLGVARCDGGAGAGVGAGWDDARAFESRVFLS